MASAPTRRLTADERRVQIVDAAIEEFAQAGLTGASTEAIARRAGISHAYLFRLFGTKRDLFLAAVDASHEHVLRTFREAEAGRAAGESQFSVLGAAYGRMIEDRKELLFQFHEFAACGDEDVRERVRAGYRGVFDWVRRTTGRSEDEVRLFMSAGLLMAVSSAIGDPYVCPDGSFILRAMP